MADTAGQPPIPATTARVLDAAAQIMGEPEPDERAYLHAILAQVSLPYKEPGTRDYVRQNGAASLILSAGMLLDPKSRKPVVMGLPHGSRPRLILLHLCSEAIRRQSATVPIADSLSGFMKSLGLAVTGGKNGTITRFRDQLNRLAGTRMQMLWDRDDRVTMINPAPIISRMELWAPQDPRQRVLWPTEVQLSGEFFDSLRDHALPLDPRAVQALQHSARALDVYVWMAHRLPRVRSRIGDKISWAALQAQFGPDIADAKNFRREFKAAFKQALAVYPGAKVSQEEGGLRINASPPPIRRAVKALPLS